MRSENMDMPAGRAVLDVLRAADTPLTVVQIAERCRYAPNTVSCVLQVAEHKGLASYELIGSRLRQWRATERLMTWRAQARPVARVVVLRVLRAADRPLTVAQISERCRYAPNTISFVLQVAESRGLVSSEWIGPGRLQQWRATRQT